MQQAVYRAGIIGLGFVGGGDQVSGDRIGQAVEHLDGHHRGALSGNPRVQLVAGCDLDEGRRNRFAEKTGAQTYADCQEMLAAERLDLVSIATSTPAHAALTLGCLEHGVRAVYCEKPIATSLAEAERMIAGCQHADALLVVNHNRRFNPNYRRLRDLIAAGGLGDLTSVSIQWPTGRLACVGTHLIDAARMLTGRGILGVSATLDLSDKPDCRGPEFDDPGGWGLLQMEGEKQPGCLEQPGCWGHGLMAVVNGGNHCKLPPEIVIEGTTGKAVTGRGDVTVTRADGHTETWPKPEDCTSMDRTVAEIVEWLDDPGPFSTPAEEALRSYETVVGFHASHALNGAWTNLPLCGADRNYRILSG